MLVMGFPMKNEMLSAAKLNLQNEIMYPRRRSASSSFCRHLPDEARKAVDALAIITQPVRGMRGPGEGLAWHAKPDASNGSSLQVPHNASPELWRMQIAVSSMLNVDDTTLEPSRGQRGREGPRAREDLQKVLVAKSRTAKPRLHLLTSGSKRPPSIIRSAGPWSKVRSWASFARTTWRSKASRTLSSSHRCATSRAF